MKKKWALTGISQTISYRFIDGLVNRQALPQSFDLLRPCIYVGKCLTVNYTSISVSMQKLIDANDSTMKVLKCACKLKMYSVHFFPVK